MSLFVLSDTHLSLASNKPMDVFGPRWDGHAQKISERWRARVDYSDTVVIAGDVSWGLSFEDALPDFEYLNALPGTKILMRGNHDYWWNTMRKLEGFKAQHGLDTVSFLFNNAINVESFTVCGTRGWYYDKKNAPPEADYAKIVARECGRLEMSYAAAEKICDGREIIPFLHFPAVYADYVCRELVDVLHAHGARRCYYGHIHGVYGEDARTLEYEGIEFILTSSDHLGFEPLLIE